MPVRTAVLLVTVIGLASTASATAQVDKPIRSPTDRLPAPATITAAQTGPGGPIRVQWAAVDGAVRYSLTRSAPPAGATSVTLPDSPDTVYIDRDVRPGSTYYYLVSAVNEAGISGLQRSAPPVKAADSTVNRPPDPPAGVTAVLNQRVVQLGWSSLRAGSDGYLVQRAKITDGRPSSWEQVATGVSCCRGNDRLDAHPEGARFRYRISAVKPSFLTADPVISNEITLGPGPSTDTTTGRPPTDTTTGQAPADTTTGRPPADTTTGQAPTDTATATRTNVRPAVVPAPARLKVGASLDVGKKSFFTSLRLGKGRWVSLDESRATVDSRGKVLGRAVGLTYIIATGLTPDGAVASVVQRVDVVRK